MAGLVSFGLLILKRCEAFSVGATLCVWIPCCYEVYDFFFIRFGHGSIPIENASIQIWYGQYMMWTLQYLRSALTVPIYFERREKIEGMIAHKVELLDLKSKRRRYLMVSLQIGVPFLWLLLYGLIGVLFPNNQSFEDISASNYYLIVTATFLAINLVIICISAYIIYRWKYKELRPLGYRWNCKDDGLFAIFTLIQLYMLALYIILVSNPKVTEIFAFEVAIQIIVMFSTLYMLGFMVKMSHSNWS